jgi:hypothetical protein
MAATRPATQPADALFALARRLDRIAGELRARPDASTLRELESLDEMIRAASHDVLAPARAAAAADAAVEFVDALQGTPAGPAAGVAARLVGGRYPIVLARSALDRALRQPHRSVDAFPIAAESMSTAADGVRRQACRERLLTVPSLTSVLRPDANDQFDDAEAVPADAAAAARPNVPAAAAPDAVELPGYDEALRAYAELLRSHGRGAAPAGQ